MSCAFVVLAGPTASGKTDLAIEAAEESGAAVEIIVLDSRQLYRGLDVGTGKPDRSQRERIQHHLLDCLDITETPDAMDYRRRVEVVASEILERGAVPFLVGGAGFYLRALREGFHDIEYTATELEPVRAELAELEDEALLERLRTVDPATAERLHPNDRYRIGRALELCILAGRPASELEADFRPSPVLGAEFHVALLMPGRELLHDRIRRRTAAWLDEGWPEEVRQILESGYAGDAPGLQILGYRQVLDLVAGERSRDEVEEDIVVATRRYARAQRTWFRKEEPALSFEAVDRQATAELAGLLRAAGGSP